MKWRIPSPEWREEVLLIRDLLGMNMFEAKAMLDKHGTAENAFNAHTSNKEDSNGN